MLLSRRRFVGTALKCLCGAAAFGVMPLATAAGRGWRFSCGGLGYGHPFVNGPVRRTSSEAEKDAVAHDQAKHGGFGTAVVIEVP